MIAKISGTLAGINQGETVLLERQGISYEINVPAAALEELGNQLGQTVTLYTLHYLEGSISGGNMFPKLVGFISSQDREFFNFFTRVKGLGIRRGLRAFAAPVGAIASAIEQGDVQFLTTLPEIGKRTAAQLVAELKGKLEKFIGTADEYVSTASMQEHQSLALEILLKLGEPRNEALELINQTQNRFPDIKDPGELIEAAYKFKAAGGIGARISRT